MNVIKTIFAHKKSIYNFLVAKIGIKWVSRILLILLYIFSYRRAPSVEDSNTKWEYTNKNRINLLEIGIGSGCIILSILKEKKNFLGKGLDLSKDSVQLCKTNAT